MQHYINKKIYKLFVSVIYYYQNPCLCGGFRILLINQFVVEKNEKFLIDV